MSTPESEINFFSLFFEIREGLNSQTVIVLIEDIRNEDVPARGPNPRRMRGMSESDEFAAIVVLDGDVCRFGSVESDTVLTLFAVASEDPSCWNEMTEFWPRYRTPVVCEFLNSLPIESVDKDWALHAIGKTDDWVLIDLNQKRIVTGGWFREVERDAAYAMMEDEDGRQRYPMSVHLPPWWELHKQAEAIDEPRQSPMERPEVNRRVLYGKPLLETIATRALEIVQSEPCSSDENEQSLHALTVEVHRDWLMTPRDDIGGLIPRQMLHGAREWIDQLIWAQQMRFNDIRELLAIPKDLVDYETAPMGRDEIVIYFELCRMLIEAAWSWCRRQNIQGKRGAGEACRADLVQYLSGVKAEWLDSPFESASSPSFIIECCRRRVPMGAGVPIVGMSQQAPAEHVIDCDCPICLMMADGSMGVAFSGLDGHQLELDDEFAFSLYETYEEWKETQVAFEKMSARLDCEQETTLDDEPDEFASVWEGHVSDEPVPGDMGAHLQLAFLLAEIVTELKAAAAPQTDIRQLNEHFASFRTCGSLELAESGRQLGDFLDSLSDRYPMLISRTADFRSRIDECTRASTNSNNTDVT